MANIKIPSAFFSSEIWRKDRVFSEAEAYLDLLTLSSPIPLRTLARRWGWKHPREVRFLRWLKASCTTFVPPCVPLILHNANALQGFCTTSCTTFVPPLKRIYPPYYLTIIFPPRLLLNSKNGYLIMLRAF